MAAARYDKDDYLAYGEYYDTDYNKVGDARTPT